MDNKFELIFNERLDAAELKNLPIDDNMNGIIEEEEMEEEGSDAEDEEDEKGKRRKEEEEQVPQVLQNAAFSKENIWDIYK